MKERFGREPDWIDIDGNGMKRFLYSAQECAALHPYVEREYLAWRVKELDGLSFKS